MHAKDLIVCPIGEVNSDSIIKELPRMLTYAYVRNELYFSQLVWAYTNPKKIR